MAPSNLTSLLRIQHPLIQGGMSWVSDHRLAAAVAEAGALGVIGAGGMDPETLRAEVRALQARTPASFAVNIPLVDVRPQGDDAVVRAQIDVVLEERVPIVITGAGSPARFTAELRDAGARVIHVVPSVRLARKSVDAGVEALVAEGIEAGGHVRADGLSTMSLVPQVVDAVEVPVIAAGGIADARGIVAALALGAQGVQLGTRFLASAECAAHPAYKRAVTEAGDEGTLVYCREYHPGRALDTPAVRELVARERAGAELEDLLAFRGRGRARAGCIDGEIEAGILPAGATVGLVRDVKSAREIVEELVRGARERLHALGADTSGWVWPDWDSRAA